MTGQGAANDSQTHSIIGPIQLFVILRESQVIQVSAAASAAAVSPARLYFMILKKINTQIKQITGGALFVSSFALHPLPIYLNPCWNWSTE